MCSYCGPVLYGLRPTAYSLPGRRIGFTWKLRFWMRVLPLSTFATAQVYTGVKLSLEKVVQFGHIHQPLYAVQDVKWSYVSLREVGLFRQNYQ